MRNGSRYDSEFYRSQRDGSASSAAVVLPLVFDLLHPESVIDIGCGVGTWLAAAGRLGAKHLVGYEGPHMTPGQIVSPDIVLHTADLSACALRIEGRFDLAMCLEVAEHVHAAAGDNIVAKLCAASDAVLFGAAIPGQGGTGHVNEQWQSYWRARFAKHGYAAYDVIRPTVWSDERVEPWYAQNTFLYMRTADAELLGLWRSGQITMTDLVNPRLWRATLDRMEKPAPREWMRQISHIPLGQIIGRAMGR